MCAAWPLAALALLASATGSCSTVWPAARDAAADPFTWLPLVGAGIFSIGDFDEDVSDWARDETPIFGSSTGAVDGSEWIRNILRSEAFLLEAVHLSVARDQSRAEWLGPPLAALGSGIAGNAAVHAMKRATDRALPSGENELAFPSGHATYMAISAYAAGEVLRRDFSEAPFAPAVNPLRLSNGALVALGSWARIEAGAHYPSDVFVGASFGHFIGRFAHELIPTGAQLEVTPVSIALVLPFGGSM